MTSIQVESWGAQGGSEADSNDPNGATYYGGLGGYVSAVIAVTPGQQLQVNVGGRPTGGSGGFNGGGSGNGYGGGGASDVRTGSFSVSERIVVAGGGGGASNGATSTQGQGGSGGGLVGEPGAGGDAGGGGGSQTAGGAGGGGTWAGGAGSLGVGGNANGAGAGGGGYYGGGGGAGYGGGGGGGGGSSYMTAAATDVTQTAGVRLGDGEVTITYPPGSSQSGPANGSASFDFVGHPQYWVVPAGVTSIGIDAYGAQGGQPDFGGLGGHATATMPVFTGEVLQVNVGGQPSGGTGGYNGGATSAGYQYGGGGATDVRVGGATLNDRVFVIGGGGGAGNGASTLAGAGGSGGTLTGDTGGEACGPSSSGAGGSQSAGGAGGQGTWAGGPGVLGIGGDASNGGGGGGGGYFGGGAGTGCAAGSGGGGGSSYTASSLTGVRHQLGIRRGNGTLTITYPPSFPTSSPTSGSVTFGFTGAAQWWTVPAGTSAIEVVAKGAQGGGLGGGAGGGVDAVVSVIGGQPLQIDVGGQPAGGESGFNGGGNANGSLYGGGGGSDVRAAGAGLKRRIVVAGGGGGAGNGTTAGAGGYGGGFFGAPGAAILCGPTQLVGGGGGSQTGGGPGAPGLWAGFDGSSGVGGTGSNGAGGGGGGYFGGGAGSGCGGGSGGGGGSSYIDAAHYIDGVSAAGAQLGNGSVQIIWPASQHVTQTETFGRGNPAENCTQCSYGLPVNAATGNYWHTYTDIAVPGRGMPLDLERTYNSLNASTDGPLGHGWSTSYMVSLSADTASGAITIRQEDGAALTFVPSGSTYAAPPRVLATLVRNADGSFTFTRRGRERFDFTSSGLLLDEKDLNGYTTTLGYYPSNRLSSVTDPAGRSLSFSYGTDGKVSGVSDSSGRSVSYTYDAAGNLKTVTDVGGRLTQFSYDANHLLASVQDPRGGLTRNDYDASGRVIDQFDPMNRETLFSYSGDTLSDAGGTTTITDPKGNVTKETYVDGVLTQRVKAYGTSSQATWRYTIDPNTLGVASVIDPNAHETDYTYDAAGNVLTETVDPGGLSRTTTNTYDALNDLLTTKDPKGVTTTMTYDAPGNLLTVSRPLTGGGTRVTTYYYDDSAHPGDPTRMKDPDNNIWTYAYDSYGDRTSITAPATPEAPSGDSTLTCYDTIGRAIRVISPRGTAAGKTCTSATPALGITASTYNAFGDVLTTTDGLGHQTIRHYDPNRNLDSLTDPQGNLTQYQYDADNERTVATRADGTTLRYTYDDDANVVQQTDGNGSITFYSYDPLDHLASTTDPLYPPNDSRARTTTYAYDGAGNLTTLTDPSGRMTTYAYDAANERTAITYSDGSTPNVSFAYDADGQRTQMTDGSGTTTYTWDSLNRPTAYTKTFMGGSTAVRFGYDLKGQLTSITYPNGKTVTRDYDNAGQLDWVTDWLGHKTTFAYYPDSDLKTETYPNSPNSVVATSTYNDADQLSGLADTNGATTLASWDYATRDRNGNLKKDSSTGFSQPDQNYNYDPLTRLTTVSSAAYGYDDADNLTKLIDDTSQSFDATNQLTSITSPITLVGTSQEADAGTTNPVTLSLPAGIAPNDQILVAVTKNAASTATTPGGYTQVGNWSLGQGDRLQLFRRTALGGETSVSVSFPGSDLHAKSVVAAVYRGVDPTGPIDAISDAETATGAATSVTASSVTTSTPGDQLVMIESALNNVAPATWTPPAGMTNRVAASSLPLVSQAIADQSLSSSGQTGTRTATLSGTATNLTLVGALVALKPLVKTLTYDQQGNRTSVAVPGSGTTTFAYDQANRLISASGATYGYDGDGVRITKTISSTTTRFAWDMTAATPLLLSDGSRNYVYGPGNRLVEQILATPTITLVGTASATDPVGTASSVTVTLPAGIKANDQIILTTSEHYTAVANTPSGYSVVSGYVGSTGNQPTVVAFRRTATGGESSATITYNNGTFGGTKVVLAAVYRGVDPASPIDGSVSAGNYGTWLTEPSISTTTSGDELVMVEDGRTTALPGAFTQPAGMTQEVTNSAAADFNTSALGDKTLGAAGPSGDQTATYNQTAPLGGVLFALRRAPVPVQYVHQDQLGSTRLITDANGDPVATYTFDPYGNTVSKTGTASTPFGFAGEYTDAETGFVYLRARYYDPVTGQFMSRDPLQALTRAPYAYAGDDPLNAWDPSGLGFWSTLGKIAGGVALVANVVTLACPFCAPVSGLIGAGASGVAFVANVASGVEDCTSGAWVHCGADLLGGAAAGFGAIAGAYATDVVDFGLAGSRYAQVITTIGQANAYAFSLAVGTWADRTDLSFSAQALGYQPLGFPC